VCATWPSNVLWFNHSNTWWRLQIMEIPVMGVSPVFHHFPPLRCKYSLQHPVLKYPQAKFLP
jgi:hypothetical protein